MNKRTAPVSMAGRREVMAYCLFFLGQNILWGYAGYVETFLTDIGISAAAAAVILLFALLIVRGFRVASRLRDRFSALVVFGLVFKVGIQTILNLAVVTNSMPNTGISLPFFSSGGTSLALQIFEMGVVLNLSRYTER